MNVKLFGITLIATGVTLVLVASALIIFWLRANNLTALSGFVLPFTLTGALISAGLFSFKLKSKNRK